MNEGEARNIMRAHRLERGMDDPRTCAEIVSERGLMPMVEIEPVAEKNPELDEIHNLTKEYVVQLPISERRPYF